ncbi:MAG: hypothetical protein HKN47_05675 [Pirellulaceae bacterium]|nr:hypothetical protein [Pirellulaceae bacterium]
MWPRSAVDDMANDIAVWLETVWYRLGDAGGLIPADRCELGDTGWMILAD